MAIMAFAATIGLQAQTHNLVVQTNKIGAPIQSTMYGLFFEDINYGADGGVYAELVKNRSFEYPQNYMGWITFGNVKLMNDGPFERNPHYVRLGNPGHREKWTGIENEGYFGIGIKEGADYRFSVWARGENQKIRVELIKNNCPGIPVPDYVDENVSTKVVRIIQSYVGVVNKMVWRKF